MGADRAIFFLHELVWNAVIIGAPVLIGTLLVGLIISILQVATQIQEITLSYVPVAALKKTPSPPRPSEDEPSRPPAPSCATEPRSKPAPNPVKIATILHSVATRTEGRFLERHPPSLLQSENDGESLGGRREKG